MKFYPSGNDFILALLVMLVKISRMLCVLFRWGKIVG